MRSEVAAWGLDLRRGWEVYPSEIAGNDPDDLVLDGTRAVLIEFPGSWLDIEDPIAVVVEAAEVVEAAGLVPVLAHPERCRPVAADPESVRPLAERGWILCLNAPSLVGGHGATAERTSWALLDAGLVALAASDGHTVARPPTLDAAYRGCASAAATRSRCRCSTAALFPGPRSGQPPVDRRLPAPLEQRIRPREVAAAEEAVARRVGGGVGSRQNVVARRVDDRSLLLRVPPQSRNTMASRRARAPR